MNPTQRLEKLTAFFRDGVVAASTLLEELASHLVHVTEVEFRPYKAGARVPEYKTSGAAGFDLSAWLTSPVFIGPGETKVVGTGLNVGIEEGYELQVRSRSGLAAKPHVHVLNSPGTVDHDYRGDGNDWELRIILHNAGSEVFVVNDGDRIAQGVVAKLPRARIRLREDLFGEHGGDRKGGLGSTGVA